MVFHAKSYRGNNGLVFQSKSQRGNHGFHSKSSRGNNGFHSKTQRGNNGFSCKKLARKQWFFMQKATEETMVWFFNQKVSEETMVFIQKVSVETMVFIQKHSEETMVFHSKSQRGNNGFSCKKLAYDHSKITRHVLTQSWVGMCLAKIVCPKVGWEYVLRKSRRGETWAPLGGPLGGFRGRRGCLLKALGRSLGPRGTTSAPLGGHLGRLGCPLGVSGGARSFWDALGFPWGGLGSFLGVSRGRRRRGENEKYPKKRNSLRKMQKRSLVFRIFFENGKHDYHLAQKLEKSVFWEALGAPWGGLGRPWGPKSSPEPTF